ncbi:MAG: type II toxin-antitoxin system RelE/ParE family toxin, partial [Streptosporangiaceae bacterium]
MLAEKGTELGGPWSDHLEGTVWELRIRLRDIAARVTYWCTPDGKIVLLTVFRKTRQHDQRQIDRAAPSPPSPCCGAWPPHWTPTCASPPATTSAPSGSRPTRPDPAGRIER